MANHAVCDDQCGRGCSGRSKGGGDDESEGVKLVDSTFMLFSESEREAKLKELRRQSVVRERGQKALNQAKKEGALWGFPDLAVGEEEHAAGPQRAGR